ncbi:hypothetical protein BDQ17DRAFT_1439953 [Cyathus striatus]|nr:hypothetical protein BDQ17DRAFT_1439953 [Cyathus striatus]
MAPSRIHLKVLGTYSEQVAERMPGVEEDADENTPPIRRAREVERIKEEGEEEGAIGWWIVQILLVVPLLVILTGHVANMSLSAMRQTLADRGSPVSVYAAVALQVCHWGHRLPRPVPNSIMDSWLC